MDRRRADHQPRGRRPRGVTETLVAGQAVNTPLLELTSVHGPRPTHGGPLAGRAERLVRRPVRGAGERALRSQRAATSEGAGRNAAAAIARTPRRSSKFTPRSPLQRGQEAADDLIEMLLGYNAATSARPRRGEERRPRAADQLAERRRPVVSRAGVAQHQRDHRHDLPGRISARARRRQRQGEIAYYWDRLENGELTPEQRTALNRPLVTGTGWQRELAAGLLLTASASRRPARWRPTASAITPTAYNGPKALAPQSGPSMAPRGRRADTHRAPCAAVNQAIACRGQPTSHV